MFIKLLYMEVLWLIFFHPCLADPKTINRNHSYTDTFRLAHSSSTKEEELALGTDYSVIFTHT